MGLFDQIMGAVANPSQQGSPDQLSGILNTVQQLSGNSGVDSSASQAAMGIVGNYVRSALQQKQAQEGQGQVEAIVNQFGGTGPNYGALQALFPPEQQQQIAATVAQRTGIPAETIQAMLPTLVPLVLNLLRTGSSNQGAAGQNNVLNAFLDSNQDGSLDIGDAMGMVGRFLR